MAEKQGGGDLVWLGRLGIGSLLGYLLIAGYLLARPPAPPNGNYCERAESSQSAYQQNCVNITVGKLAVSAGTVGQVDWYTSPPHDPELSHLSMRRHGKVEHGYRYDLFVPGKLEPVGTMDHDDGWIILRFLGNPSREHALKSDQPTFSSWAE